MCALTVGQIIIGGSDEVIIAERPPHGDTVNIYMFRYHIGDGPGDWRLFHRAYLTQDQSIPGDEIDRIWAAILKGDMSFVPADINKVMIGPDTELLGVDDLFPNGEHPKRLRPAFD